MASVVETANRALTKLGAARIASLTDDNKQARAVNSCFYALLDAELRANRWTFAIKRATLAALTESPEFGYAYQYQLPDDFLRLDMIGDIFPSVPMDNYISTETEDYAIEGNLILTDLTAPLKIRYGARILDPEQWDALFIEALACRIAAEICEDLTQSSGKRQQAWNEYTAALKAAKRVNALERPPATFQDNSWVFSRL